MEVELRPEADVMLKQVQDLVTAQAQIASVDLQIRKSGNVTVRVNGVPI
jgi:hypothetical protein